MRRLIPDTVFGRLFLATVCVIATMLVIIVLLILRERLEWAFDDLIRNALRYGGKTTVRIEDGEVLTVRVLDEGPGIPDEMLERVFEPFYRLETSRNRDSGGTGLGLSIARDIAQAHGGTLVLMNRTSGGLEARLTLPRRAPEDAS